MDRRFNEQRDGGRPLLGVFGVGDDPRFATFTGRTAHRDDVETLMVNGCAARESAVIRTLTEADAAVGPVIDMADLAADPHFRERETITDVGGTPMQPLIARLSKTQTSGTSGMSKGRRTAPSPSATVTTSLAGDV